MNRKTIIKKIKITLVAIAISASLFTAYSFTDSYFEISKNLDIFATLFREVNTYYVDETKPGDMMKKAIDSMLDDLDPYTNYIPESELEDYKYMTTGQYGGIGSLIRKKGDYIAISEPYEGFPAQKGGLIAGDIILEVDGKSIKGKNTDEVSKVLKGSPNTPVKLLIKREGESANITKIITREEIKVNNVPYSGMVDDGIGYVYLNQFTEDASKNVKDAIIDLKTNNPDLKGIILDLRGNPGGLLHEAVNLSNLFVEKGTEIVSTKGKVSEWQKSYKALNAPIDLNLPIAILVNRGSASASEIVSGAIQDLDRGIVVGQKTFGKGLVQTTRNLTYNSKLKVTTAKYYIPSGRCIQALDYTHRNEDGSVGKVPDSIITAFKTKNGRKVFDGGGVNPDVKVKPKIASKILISLDSKALIFDYATQFKLNHPSIGSAKQFRLSDEEYDKFCKWLEDKEYDYTTDTQKELEELKKIAIEEKYFDKASKELEQLKEVISHNKTHDLENFKTEIKTELENEIVARYYYQKGKLEHSLSLDLEVKKATEILKDQKLYGEILAGKYVDPEIK
ncbi:MAG: S41 family peptidase [Bacteroidota bacterium]|jgi:carboxyl-terminal processing protease